MRRMSFYILHFQNSGHDAYAMFIDYVSILYYYGYLYGYKDTLTKYPIINNSSKHREMCVKALPT